MTTQSPLFYNRDLDRLSLRRTIASNRSELVILYGRRGVGKSALLRRVFQDEGQPFLYFRAARRTLNLQLQEITDALHLTYPELFLPQPLTSFGVFLETLTHLAEMRQKSGGAPVCAVIDELPYLAEVDPGLLTTLQHWWDDNKHRPNLKMYLAGSYVSFMETQVLDERAPLYNRRTGAMKIEPMDYADAGLFFSNYSPRDRMTAFAVLGGMPSYLEQFDSSLSLQQNTLNTILRPHTYLSEEPKWLLLEDLRREIVYGSILRAVAQGERKPSDIAKAIGQQSAQDVSRQLGVLNDMGLILREVPITERLKSRSRNSQYYLADNYLDFWYRYVDPSRSLIEQELGSMIWDRTIAPDLDRYVSRPTFERACRAYLWRARRAGKLPDTLQFTEVGTWWGDGDKEIDVVCADVDGAVTLVGSCKWTNSPIDVAEYADLIGTAKAAASDLSLGGDKVGAADGPWLALFSRSGFTPRLIEVVATQRPVFCSLISLTDLYSV